MKALLFALVIAICLNAIAAQSCNCNGRGNCTLGYCACFSGFSGSACLTAAPSSCGFNAIDKLKTKYPFSLSSTTFTGNNLIQTVTSPLVTDRLNSTIFYSGSEGLTACQYPGPNWAKSIESCSDRFRGQTRWSTARTCGTWILDNTSPDYAIYTNTLVVKSNELVDMVRGEPVTRNLQYNYPVMVRFQKNLMVCSVFRSFALPLIDSAITKQSVDVENGVGILELTTNVQWPFKYSNPALTEVPTGYSIVSVTEVGAAGQCIADQPCTQVWRITFPLGEMCTLNGNWTFRFNEVCHPSYGGSCPIPTTGKQSSVFATLTSENFCAISQVDIQLGGNLQSFENAARTIPKSGFLQGATAFFRLNSFSNQASIQTTVIDEIVTSSGFTTTFLYQNGAATADGTNSAISVTNTVTTNTANFQFTVNQISAPVAVDQNRDYIIRVKFQVTYTDNVVRTITEQFQITRQVDGVSRGALAIQGKRSSAATIGTSLVLVLLSLLFVLL